MSFQIDLLHENERKVGSIATIKAVAKGIVLLLIGLLVLLVAQLSFALVARNLNLANLEESWKLLDRRQEMAMTMRSQMVYNETTQAQFAATPDLISSMRLVSAGVLSAALIEDKFSYASIKRVYPFSAASSAESCRSSVDL